ncbi:unnamed protein product [Effrenium voratum]|uniref:Uncharacterized protein n=1 Tax=Effrenium voratum TaxID=2562239 RepID=A0AA36JIW4_9DINO|nr:unnamed protein product [Effrenium voratum]CAJ1437675.1 unnamed protein product [Effrenium voratum]
MGAAASEVPSTEASCACDKSAGEKVIIQAIPASCCTNIQSANEDSKGVLNQRLLRASRDNDIGGLKLALEEGAYLETRRPFVMRPKPPTSMWDNDADWPVKKKGPKEGMTPLMYASLNGSLSAVHMLLQARANAMAKDEDGLRPLHFAAQSAAKEVCGLLVQKKADVAAVDDEGKTAIECLPGEELTSEVQKRFWEELLGSGPLPRSKPREQAAKQVAATLPDQDNLEADLLWLANEPIRKA